jgi:hypothetical protein
MIMNKHNRIQGKLSGMLAVMLLLSAAVQATYTSTYLPVSNYGWEGRTYYTLNGVNATVEYAVYDNKASQFPSLFSGVGTGQYVYAYQAFNTNFNSTAQAIATFELIGGNPAQASGIGSKDDGHSGIVPTNNGASFVWNFANGVFVVNEHSVLMVFSTNAKPKEGSCQLTTTLDNGDKPPTPETPEPATMAMLAAGAIGLLTKRKTQKS